MSDNIKYLVTSATGNVGYQVARQLLEKGCDVRVMSRSEGKIIKELVGLGAEMFLGHMNKKEDLDRAVKGIDRVFYCHRVSNGLLNNTTLFATAAKAAGVTTVINIGQFLASLPEHRSRSTQEHKQSYPMLDNADIGTIHVVPGFFADNVLRSQLYITQLGIFPFPLGDGICPWVSNKDIAAVSVALLMKPEGHVGKHYQPTGPKALSTQDLLDSFGRILGRKIRSTPLPERLFLKACLTLGLDDYGISQFRYYLEDFQNGVFNYQPTDVVKKLTGRPAEDFDVTARRYFERENQMNRTLGGRLSSMKAFMKVGFVSAPSKKEMDLLNQ